MRVTLTDLAVKNLAVPERGQSTYLDRMIPGFGVRVSQGGTKTFTLVYGPHRKRISLGRYPIVSLANARKKAQDILAAKQLGILHEVSRMTFEDGYSLFLQGYEAKNRPKTIYEMQRIVKRHLMPAFKRYPLVDISAQEIAAIIEKRFATPAECQKLTSTGPLPASSAHPASDDRAYASNCRSHGYSLLGGDQTLRYLLNQSSVCCQASLAAASS